MPPPVPLIDQDAFRGMVQDAARQAAGGSSASYPGGC